VLQEPGVPTAAGDGGEYAVQVRDCSDAVLAEHRFEPALIDVDGEVSEYASFAFVLPAPETACSLVLLHQSDVLDSRTISANAPVVSLVTPDGGEMWTGDATVSWTASDEDADELSFALMYSADAGASWLPVATGLTGNEYVVDSDTLPGSDDARIRILASDGANTSEDQSAAAFSVVPKAPRVAVATPADGETFDVLVPLALSGTARDTFGALLPVDSQRWSVDGEIIGVGNDLAVRLDVGTHEILLEYLDGESAVASATSTVTITDASDVCGHASGSAADAAITATDALVALNAAVGLLTCEACRCDVDASGSVVASDALVILNLAVGLDGPRDCGPCA
jgi:hypothetical protein